MARAKSTPGKKKSSKTKAGRWPKERAVLFKPERKSYVRKLLPDRGCVFCTARAQGANPESLLLVDNGLAMVIMNKYPYNSGHLLVLPSRHCGDFTALSSEEHAAINAYLTLSLKALGEIAKPAGYNVGLNLGAAAGAGIPDHMHYHVIPRWNGDTNFFPLIGQTKVVIETLEQTYARLRPFFEK